MLKVAAVNGSEPFSTGVHPAIAANAIAMVNLNNILLHY